MRRWGFPGKHPSGDSKGSALLAALLTAALVAGCSSVSVTVNGRRLDVGEFSREVERRVGRIEEKAAGELEGARGARLREETERQVATGMIRSALMEEEAGKLGVAPDRGEVARRLEEERSRLGADDFERALEEKDMSEDEYREEIARELLVEALGERVGGEVLVTREEAESYFLSDPSRFGRAPMVRVAHILVDTEGQATMVADRVAGGEDFAALASAVSQDMTTRDSGGDMGWIERGTMDPVLEEAAFALEIGESSGVVRGSGGFHILKVLDRRGAYEPTFEEVGDRVIQELLHVKREEEFSDWLRTVYANAEVKVSGRLGRWDPRLGILVK